jgi:hypothetical protein
MGIRYMLWGAAPGNGTWRGITDELTAAIARFRAKYGKSPTIALISARELGDAGVPTIEGMRIEARGHVPARMMMIGG